MPLDPFLQAYIRKKAVEPRFSVLDVAGARASKVASRFEVWPGAGLVTARDVEIPMDWGRCRARFYRPEGDDILPLVVFLHGGGFVVCDIETHDGLARGICGGAQVAVLSVDYRLAPEHPCPAGVDDAVASLKWAVSREHELGVDPTRIFVAGDSAGGNLAVAAALRLGREGGVPPLAGQILCYPILDAPWSGQPSYDDFAEGFGLTRQDMEWFWAHYVQDASGEEAMPLRAASLVDCPPTFLLTAEYDVLRDEGEAFAARLYREGVAITGRRYLGANHNFLAFAESLSQAGQAVSDICAWLRMRAGI